MALSRHQKNNPPVPQRIIALVDNSAVILGTAAVPAVFSFIIPAFGYGHLHTDFRITVYRIIHINADFLLLVPGNLHYQYHIPCYKNKQHHEKRYPFP